MKVLHIGKYYYPYRGGIETFLYNLCTYLKDRIDVQVLAANTHLKTVVDNVDGVKVTRAACMGKLLSTPLCPSFPRYIRSSDADIIHIHSPNPLPEIAFLLADKGKRLVISYHSDIVRQKKTGIFYLPLQRKLLRMADKIVAATPNHIRYSPMLSKFREKCIVIPYGIDLSRYKKTSHISGRIAEIKAIYGEHIILFVGRLVNYKGVEYAIRAMQKIEARLLIAGSGQEE
ncbi:MAG: glycosyltransferase, partial [Nitrospinae bacterium]|nr:glycosyltransferase [Nitrospinota bacterium]